MSPERFSGRSREPAPGSGEGRGEEKPEKGQGNGSEENPFADLLRSADAKEPLRDGELDQMLDELLGKDAEAVTSPEAVEAAGAAAGADGEKVEEALASPDAKRGIIRSALAWLKQQWPEMAMGFAAGTVTRLALKTAFAGKVVALGAAVGAVSGGARGGFRSYRAERAAQKFVAKDILDYIKDNNLTSLEDHSTYGEISMAAVALVKTRRALRAGKIAGSEAEMREIAEVDSAMSASLIQYNDRTSSQEWGHEKSALLFEAIRATENPETNIDSAKAKKIEKILNEWEFEKTAVDRAKIMQAIGKGALVGAAFGALGGAAGNWVAAKIHGVDLWGGHGGAPRPAGSGALAGIARMKPGAGVLRADVPDFLHSQGGHALKPGEGVLLSTEVAKEVAEKAHAAMVTAGEIAKGAKAALVGEQITVTAEAGEGHTHLAREAIHKLLVDRAHIDPKVAEHVDIRKLVFMEDWLSKHSFAAEAGKALAVGDVHTFSVQDVLAAQEQANRLTEQQLENIGGLLNTPEHHISHKTAAWMMNLKEAVSPEQTPAAPDLSRVGAAARSAVEGPTPAPPAGAGKAVVEGAKATLEGKVPGAGVSETVAAAAPTPELTPTPHPTVAPTPEAPSPTPVPESGAVDNEVLRNAGRAAREKRRPAGGSYAMKLVWFGLAGVAAWGAVKALKRESRVADGKEKKEAGVESGDSGKLKPYKKILAVEGLLRWTTGERRTHAINKVAEVLHALDKSEIKKLRQHHEFWFDDRLQSKASGISMGIGGLSFTIGLGLDSQEIVRLLREEVLTGKVAAAIERQKARGSYSKRMNLLDPREHYRESKKRETGIAQGQASEEVVVSEALGSTQTISDENVPEGEGQQPVESPEASMAEQERVNVEAESGFEGLKRSAHSLMERLGGTALTVGEIEAESRRFGYQAEVVHRTGGGEYDWRLIRIFNEKSGQALIVPNVRRPMGQTPLRDYFDFSGYSYNGVDAFRKEAVRRLCYQQRTDDGSWSTSSKGMIQP